MRPGCSYLWLRIDGGWLGLAFFSCTAKSPGSQCLRCGRWLPKGAAAVTDRTVSKGDCGCSGPLPIPGAQFIVRERCPRRPGPPLMSPPPTSTTTARSVIKYPTGGACDMFQMMEMNPGRHRDKNPNCIIIFTLSDSNWLNCLIGKPIVN